jgi:hypothetical protein
MREWQSVTAQGPPLALLQAQQLQRKWRLGQQQTLQALQLAVM